MSGCPDHATHLSWCKNCQEAQVESLSEAEAKRRMREAMDDRDSRHAADESRLDAYRVENEKIVT